MTAQRLDNGVTVWSDPRDEEQFVVLISPHISPAEELVNRVLESHTAARKGEIDEDALASELGEAIGQRVWVRQWRNPAGLVEYEVELEGRDVDWEWLA